MSFVPAKCPLCGREIQLDDHQETGFCAYCGSKVVVKEAVQEMEFTGSLSVDGVGTIEKQLQNAETFYKLGEHEKETEILKQMTQDYPDDYHGWLRLALKHIDEYGMERPINNFDENKTPIFFFGKCYLPNTDDCIDDYFRLLSDKNIKYSLILAPESKVVEMKRKLRELGKPLVSYLIAEKPALIRSRDYFQESIKVRERAINAFQNSRKESSQSFFFKKKVPVSNYDLWTQCLDNELECSTIDREIYDSYWIYPDGYRYKEWKNNGNYGEFYKMYFRDCNSSYCSIDVGIKRNEENLIAVSNIMDEYNL